MEEEDLDEDVDLEEDLDEEEDLNEKDLNEEDLEEDSESEDKEPIKIIKIGEYHENDKLFCEIEKEEDKKEVSINDKIQQMLQSNKHIEYRKMSIKDLRKMFVDYGINDENVLKMKKNEVMKLLGIEITL